MYSLNVPVPGSVSALASELAREVPQARARTRENRTLVVKRLEDGDRTAFDRFAARAREELRGAPAFAARVTGIDYFPEAVSGPSPVVYLAVDSPGLVDVHRMLASAFDPVEDIEGDGYVPHVTIARGGSLDAARRLVDREIDPIEWDVSELTFWDAQRCQPAGTISLPA